MNEPIEFLHKYCDFSNPNAVWMLKRISRNKDNNGTGVKFMRRLVLRKPEEIEECRTEIMKLADDPNTTYRLYVSLNSRDVVKGLFNFQKKLIDIGTDLARGIDDAVWMSKKVHSLWKTELEQRSNRGTKRILLDIDNENADTKAIAVVAFLCKRTTVHAMRRTVSGYAISFDACDTRDLLEFVQSLDIKTDKNTLQRDSMVFIEQWKGAGC